MNYLQEMSAHEAWMANSRRASKEFAEEMAQIDSCSCDQDPLGVCPQHGPQSLTDAMYNATLLDCLAECAESNPVAPAVRYR